MGADRTCRHLCQPLEAAIRPWNTPDGLLRSPPRQRVREGAKPAGDAVGGTEGGPVPRKR